jgi:molecular chaperone DnaK
MRRIIGIDLGTTNSAAAFLDGDEPKVIPNDRGNRITPSIVAFTKEEKNILVGEAAKNQAVINAERTILNVKRSMGKKKRFSVDGKQYAPEDISSFILKKIKKDVEAYLGEEVKHAVITVPAYFTENQRKATKEAGKLAGFSVKRIINEPTAAAIAYAYEVSNNCNILVYDLGGGTFDVTYLKKRGNTFTVLSSNGDNNLGGIDFDTLIRDKVVEYFTADSGINIKDDKIIMQQLLEQIERAKIELSTMNSAHIALPFVSGTSKSAHLSYTVTREEFEHLIRDKIEETIALSKKTVREAGGKPEDVDRLILSGGSSRIPLVRELLAGEFSVGPEKKINPEEVVSLGAALQASLIAGEVEDIILKDITPFSLGVEIEGGKFIRILDKNSKVPVQKKRLFTTISDEQRSVEIHVMQGESENAKENSSLGRFLLSGIREGKKGTPRIEVTFTVDTDGILHVTARDMDTNVEQQVSVTSDYKEDDEVKGEKSEEKIKKRVSILIDRVTRELDRRTDIDNNFREEIKEIIKKADGAMKKKEKKSLLECQIALETIIGELNAVGVDAEEVEYG